MRRVAICIVLMTSLLAVPGGASDRTAQISQALVASLARLDNNLDGSGDIAARKLANGALAALVVNDEPERAARYLDAELSVQRGDGSLPWNYRGPASADANATDFGTQSWGPILLGFSERLPQDLHASLAAHARAALPVLYAHHVAVRYTNIYLINAVTIELIGEALQDARAQAYGESRLEQWITYTRNAGIHEYESPQYYGLDLSALEMGYRYTKDAAVRATLRRILAYFWKDIAANYLRPINRLIGAHSRDYNFVGEGAGLIDVYTYGAGWGDERLGNVDPEVVYALIAASPGGYLPDATIFAIANQPGRVVEQLWNPDPAAWRYTYVGSGYAIGSANGSYGEQDKLVVIDVAMGSRDLQIAPVVTRPSEDPYGIQRHANANGHHTPTHDLVAPALVADRNRLVAAYDVPAGDTFSALMPNEATVTPIPGGAKIALAGDGAFADVRIEIAGGAAGSVIRDGGSTGAMRFAVTASSPLRVTLGAIVGEHPAEAPSLSSVPQVRPPRSPLMVNGAAIEL